MTVEVGYEVEEEVTREHLSHLRSGASRLTIDPKTIRVEASTRGSRNAVVVTFAMRKTAQYKVVGDIHHQFKLSFGSNHLYVDSWIGFPTERPRKKHGRSSR